MSSVDNVCRLCLSKDNLVWVFDKRFDSGNNLKDVILITTGVEVYQNDVISQKVCNKCCHIAVKMFQFRNVSQKHDKYLKEQYKEMFKTSSVKDEIPTTGEAVKTEKMVEPKKETIEVKPNYKIHQSVKDMYKVYPRLKLPSTCLKSDFQPWVMMEMDTVENYLKKETRNERKRIRLSKPENRTAKKSTSAATITIDPLLISSMPVLSVSDGFNKDQKKSEFTRVGITEIENLNKDDDSNIIEKITAKPTKRRLSDSDFFSDTDAKHSSLSKVLPKKNSIKESADKLCLDKSVPLFICSICNSVHNNFNALKRHNYKHLRCQFCRSRFRTVVLKEAHIKSLCTIKNMMNHLPSVKLERIELDLRMRNTYPAAFIGYPSIPGLQLHSNSTNEEESSGDDHSDDRTSADEISGNMTSEKQKKAVDFNDDNDVIEIFSDDDMSLPPGNDISISTPVRQTEIVPHTNITQGTIKSECSTTKTAVTEIVSLVTDPSLVFTFTPVISSIPQFGSTTSSIISTTSSIISTTPSIISTTSSVIATTSPVIATTLPDISSASSVIPTTPAPPVLMMAPEDNLSSSIVKPEIIIKRNSVLDTIDPRFTDIKVLKELLTNHTEFTFEKETFSQTEFPSNQSICRNKSDKSTELRNLKNVLFAYKIPISIKNGEFNVRYDFNSTNVKPQQSKKLHLWSDLIPIDVKVVNESSNKQGSVQDRISKVATPNRSSPGVTSKSTSTRISKVATPIRSSPGITSNCTSTRISEVATPICSSPAITSNSTSTPTYPCNPLFIALPNQQTYARNESFSTPVNSFNGSATVQVYPQVVSSNYGFVNNAPSTTDLTYVLVRTTTAEQQSNTNTTDCFAASNVQMYPQSVNGITTVPSNFGVANKSVAKDSTIVRPLAGTPKTPISHVNDMRGPPNVYPFLKVAAPKTSPGLSINSMNSTPPNVGNSHKMIYNLQNSMVIQNKVPNPVTNPIPNPVPNMVTNLTPISSTPGSSEAVPVFGTIRVKNMWELK